MTVDEHDADLVPLSDRLAVLLIARLAIAASVIIAVGVVGDVVVDPSGTVELAAVLYAGVTTAVELTRRKLGWRGLLAVSALLVVDGIFLAFVVGQTGGRDSLLTFLIYFHIVAVTLVASYRTGLKVAVWHALLMVGGSSAVVAYYLRGEDPAFDGAAAFRASTLLVLAIGAAAFSSLNERGLNHSRRQIQSLLDLSSDFEREEWPEEICAVLAVHVHRRMRFRRALVVAEEEVASSGRSPTTPPACGSRRPPRRARPAGWWPSAGAPAPRDSCGRWTRPPTPSSTGSCPSPTTSSRCRCWRTGRRSGCCWPSGPGVAGAACRRRRWPHSSSPPGTPPCPCGPACCSARSTGWPVTTA